MWDGIQKSVQKVPLIWNARKSIPDMFIFTDYRNKTDCAGFANTILADENVSTIQRNTPG